MASDTPTDPSSAGAPPPAGAGAAAAVAPTGFGKVLAILLGKEAAAYAALLVFSLATITGSMYVLSSRETDLAIRATVRYGGGAFTTEGSADFTPDTGVRTVIVSFEGGVVSGIRDAVTSLAGAIRAVSSNIIDEARREEAARAAAQAARTSTFGLSADTQLVAQAPALSASAVQALAGGAQPTAVVAPQPTAPPAPATAAAGTGTGAVAPPTTAPTTAPAAPTTAPAAQAPAQGPAQPPAVPTATPAPPAPTATPVPPTATPRPTDPPSTGGGGAQPTSAPSGPSTAPTSAPAAATSAPAAATQAPVATAVPAATVVQPTSTPNVAPTATLIPTPGATSTPVPVTLNLLTPAGTSSCPWCVASVFSSVPKLNVGDTVFQQVNIGNSGTVGFALYLYTECPSCGVGNLLWDDGGDGSTGLQMKVTRTGGGAVDYLVYQGRVKLDEVNKRWVDDFPQGRQDTIKIELSMPVHVSDAVSNAMQGMVAPITFQFAMVG